MIIRADKQASIAGHSGLEKPENLCTSTALPCPDRFVMHEYLHLTSMAGAGDWRLAVDLRVTEFEVRLRGSAKTLAVRRKRQRLDPEKDAIPATSSPRGNTPASVFQSSNLRKARWKHRQLLHPVKSLSSHSLQKLQQTHHRESLH
jgi:hypothetical protein